MCNTGVVRYVMCIVLQHDKSVHDLSDTGASGQFYSIPRLQWHMHGPLVQHGFKIIFISIKPVVDPLLL